MTVFRTAHYRADGTLVRVSEAFPTEAHHDPQTVADLCARAADTGCTYQAGTFLVWADLEVGPGAWIEQSPRADGRRSYGGQHPPAPVTGSDHGLEQPLSVHRRWQPPNESGVPGPSSGPGTPVQIKNRVSRG